MALGTLSPRLPVETPKIRSGGGGRPPLDRSRGGGGGGGRGGDNRPDYGERLRRYRLGMAVGLVSIVMLFVSFSLTYIFRKMGGVYDQATGMIVRDWQPLHIPLGILWANTLVITVSSLTMELARRQAAQRVLLAPVLAIPGIKADDRRPMPWLGITVLLGFGFIVGQILAWKDLQNHGWFLSTGPSSSFFYILTGTHAVHLVGGLVALCYAVFATRRQRPVEERRIIVDVTSWYWHVIGALWIYLFALLAIAR
ncbi:MAG TPA: cytochrome c oxidase subunit 3 [Terriglobales bacterium]|nr:cytochrome c oxidase subunit 3 [Terriglobales bacterium]